MKNILAVVGTFTFAMFSEFFIRIVIIFYHHGEYQFYGISNLPGISWIIILGVGIFVATWISGMLLITITNFSIIRHLLSLFTLILFMRVSEFLAMENQEWLYSFSITIIQAFALYLAYFTKNKFYASSSDH